MAVKSVVDLAVAKAALRPSPIRPEWILEGEPVASNKVLSSSADGSASTVIWECTAGRFNWFYDFDETIYVLEGGMVIKDHAGAVHRLSAGDTIFFPIGSSAEWHVENYVRKVAFCRSPLPRPLEFCRRMVRLLKRGLLGQKSAPMGAVLGGG